MKTKLTLLIVFLLTLKSFGQLQVNAGNDTILCLESLRTDSIELGGNPTAFGGVEPYVYNWSTNYNIGSSSFEASVFLDDPTKSNPRLKGGVFDLLKFNLTVTDNNGTQIVDSITIRFSSFMYTLEDVFANIKKGDTITLGHNINLGIAPLTFSWSPNYNISDTTISNPKAWPDTTVNYKVVAIDSIGCISYPDIFEVYVNPVGIQSKNNKKYASQLFPNPIDNNSMVYINNFNHGNLTIKVLNSTGQVIHFNTFSTDSYEIGEKINESGLYLYVISKDSEIVSYGRFIKK